MAPFIGQYEVISDLGVGRFGTVVLASGDVPGRGAERPTRQIVAIKRLRDLADRERAVSALRQKLARVDQVADRRIARVYEVLPDDNAIVMEYVHGVTLAAALDALRKAREQFFTEAAVEIACEIAEALFAANTRLAPNGEPLGLVHLRLKPAHLMLTPGGDVKLLDFGLAHLMPVDSAGGRAAADDLIYQAPEQARGEETDHRTDLFSLGLVLFELLMSEPAYPNGEGGADASAELLRKVRMGDLREPCRRLEQTLPALGPIVRKLLAARPDERYRSGADLVSDLRRQLYRDRGAYLKEFDEFYFSAIRPIAPAPVLEDGGNRTRRRSIEERLRESISRESAPSPPVVSSPPDPRPAGGPPPSPRPRATAAPPPSTPLAGAGRVEAKPTRAPAPPAVPQQGDPMAAPGGGKKSPPRPPIGGGASRVTAFEPSSDSAVKRGGGPPRAAGERRPDEAGMLEMVPLSADKDKSAAAEDPSATAFFAIPAPKADRAKGVVPPPPPSMPQPTPSLSGVGPPVARPPLGGGNNMGAAPPQPLVSGPVVSYGGAAQSPFQVSGPSQGMAPPADAGQRVQSNRVYAILVAVFALVGIAVVAAIWFRPEPPPPPPPPPVLNTPTPVVTTTAKAVEDTGVPAPVPKPATPKPKATVTHVAAPVASGPAPLTVHLADATQATSIEVTCPSNFRNRASLKGGVGTIGAVPQESCNLIFHGGPPAAYAPVHGGQSLNCSIVGTTAVCK